MKPKIPETVRSEAKAVSLINPLIFNWRDPKASIPKRIIAAIGCVALAPLWLVLLLIGWGAWIISIFFPNFLPNAKSEGPPPPLDNSKQEVNGGSLH